MATQHPTHNIQGVKRSYRWLYTVKLPNIYGAAETALLVKRDWNGWILRIYHDKTVPPKYLKPLQDLDVELLQIRSTKDAHSGMLCRFLPILDPSVTRLIVRDPDSRLS